MATNVEDKLKEALQGFTIRSMYGWLDSSVKGGGNYKQFVRNRVRKIRTRITFVGETLERRTTLLISEVVIYSRPLWLAHQQQWPPDNVTCRTRETQAEATVIREVLAVTIETNERHDELMQK